MSTSHERFTAMWHEDAPRVMAFARRHVGGEAAPDVVAETFLAAWRRLSIVPDPPIAWLIATARKVMQNHHRTARRNQALEHRIALLDAVAAQAEPDDAALSRTEAIRRLAELDEQHREALLLVSWDGLTNDEAAKALGIRPAAFRQRVSRARATLRADSIESDPDLASHRS